MTFSRQAWPSTLSPSTAKGRVERMNRTLQDRLVKALRRRGISDLETANRFLAEEFLEPFNAQFGVVPSHAWHLHWTNLDPTTN